MPRLFDDSIPKPRIFGRSWDLLSFMLRSRHEPIHSRSQSEPPRHADPLQDGLIPDLSDIPCESGRHVVSLRSGLIPVVLVWSLKLNRREQEPIHVAAEPAADQQQRGIMRVFADVDVGILGEHDHFRLLRNDGSAKRMVRMCRGGIVRWFADAGEASHDSTVFLLTQASSATSACVSW
jgi:hypothetical protein